jgi:hypothetical protein
MGHACSSVICTFKLCLVLGVCLAFACRLALKELAAGVLISERSTSRALQSERRRPKVHFYTLDLGSGRDTR